ncbi:MAG: hypothetical protein MMC33_003253 [Icmadophila ericetorum]|nr:hypothetical protein [Icmadophila ericetorum]
MAPATGIPEARSSGDREREEDEPLLGQPGDVAQKEEKGLGWNFLMGTASIAQAGIWILTAMVWASVLTNMKLSLFSAHPLANSAGLLLSTQAILVLQPTHLPKQKKQGTIIHALLNGAGLASLITAGAIMFYLHRTSGHFASIHGTMGLVTYIIFIIQSLVGFTQYYTPQLYGSVENAKSVWKYHRMSGYVLLTLSLATVAAATQTPTGENTLKLKLWAVLVCSVLTLVGVLPRIKKQKLGL